VKIFVINLKRSPERLKKITHRLKELSLDFERIEAVDGATLNNFKESFNSKRFFYESGHKLVAGEAGCSQSHINIWQLIIARKLNYALVLEDDVLIDEDLSQLINNKSIYESFDYLKLDNKLDKIAEIFHCNQEEVLESKHIIDKKQHSKYTTIEVDPVPYGMGAYIISRKACQIFLKSTHNMYFPIDLLPRYTFPYTRQGVILPNLVHHQEIRESDIEGRVFEQSKESIPLKYKLSKLFSTRVLRKLTVLKRKLGI